MVLYLYGTPGQERFDLTWDDGTGEMLGYLLLLDGSRPASIAEARPHVAFFRRRGKPFIVAVNKTGGTDVEAVGAELGVDRGAVVCVDALDRESVKGTLVAFLERVLT